MIEFRTGDLADIFGVHRNTVRNWIKTGRLSAASLPGKKYAIQREGLVQFLESMGVAPSVAAGMIDKAAGSAGSPPSLEVEATHQSPIIKKEVPMSDKTVGSVMVVGGGIASIQASLDLAESGYYVYLVERQPGIGGRMAQLDKTFPTNDCAM